MNRTNPIVVLLPTTDGYTRRGIWCNDPAADLAELTIVRAERVRRQVSTESGAVDAIDTLVRAIRPRPSDTQVPPRA